MTKLMVKANICMQMEQAMKDNGSKINKKGWVVSVGPTEASIRVCTKMVKSTDKVNLHGKMAPLIPVIGFKIRCTGTVSSFGLTVAATMASTKMIESTGVVFSSTLTAD